MNEKYYDKDVLKTIHILKGNCNFCNPYSIELRMTMKYLQSEEWADQVYPRDIFPSIRNQWDEHKVMIIAEKERQNDS